MSQALEAASSVIETRRLGKRYGPHVALDDLDLDVGSGESIVVFGPNGAGKTTLLRILATLTRPSVGSLKLFKESSSGPDPGALRSRIGYLSHRTFLYDHLTARENLLFYARLYALHDVESAVREALLGARLWERRDETVSGYSRGMQQRLAIARALLHRPDLILLDEPFTGLDRESSLDLEERLRSLHREGRTIIMVTHDLEQGLAASDRVWLLLEGRLELDALARSLDRGRLEQRLLAKAGRPAAGAP